MGESAEEEEEEGGPFVVEEVVHGVGEDNQQEYAQKGKEVGLVLVEDDGGGGQQYFGNEFHDDEVGLGVKWLFEILPIFLEVAFLEQMVNIVQVVLPVVEVEVGFLCPVKQSCLAFAVYCCELHSAHHHQQQQ